jgi:predicted O-methyltransferase YrrM
MMAFNSLLARARLWTGFFSKISYPRDLQLVIQAFRKRRTFQVPVETWASVKSTGGFLSEKEAGLLHWAASQWPVIGPVLELGSYEGRSTIVFARAGRHVHAIDAWSLGVDDLSAYGGGQTLADDVLDQFQVNIRRIQVEAHVTMHRGLTHEIGRLWKTPGAILFVDAGHTYTDVKGDLDIWTPHLMPGGLLLMHDVLGDVYLDVTRAASELIQQGWQVEVSAGSIVGFTRTAGVP